MQIVMAISLNVDAIRKVIYKLFIGVSPGKESLLIELIGTPFEAVVSVFDNDNNGNFDRHICYITRS